MVVSGWLSKDGVGEDGGRPNGGAQQRKKKKVTMHWPYQSRLSELVIKRLVTQVTRRNIKMKDRQ
jgi:hypothetical protein